MTQMACFMYLIAGTCLAPFADARDLTVTVLNANGEPVADVAVYWQSSDSESLPSPPEYAVMDQIDTRFEPHILVVQSGTEVRFPNSDVVAHHVYSFSNPNDFMLPLYKGNAHPPVTLDEPGVVILGCNIHDQMLGYILVVDSHIYSKTDDNGVAVLSIDSELPGAVNVWSPRIDQKGESLSQTVSAGSESVIVFRLSGKLRPPHSSDSGALKWSDY
jgi:plastocyanin